MTVKGEAAVENVWQFLKMSYVSHITHNPTSGYASERNDKHVHTTTYSTGTFAAALFILIKMWKKPKWQSTDE